MDGDNPLVSAFEPKEDEDSLSVNWMEYFGTTSREEAVDRVREAFRQKPYKLGAKARFVVLNVGAALLAATKVEGCTLEAIHRPEDNDPSHAQLEGVPQGELAVDLATELQALVQQGDVFPARGEVPSEPAP